MGQADLFGPENRIDHVEITTALRSTWYEVAGDRRSGAVFDPTRRYRYSLWRVWERSAGVVLWIMLNPSTADESVLDPTLRRCQDYARRWGFGGFEVANLYAYRSPNPDDLWRQDDPVGPLNDRAILLHCAQAKLVMVGWGGKAKSDRVSAIQTLLPIGTMCLRKNADGSPVHPLYQPKTLEPIPWP